jgi:hypothetical protein
MNRFVLGAVLALALAAAPALAEGITGKYVEARTCDVWTAPCYANSEMNLSGKHALLGWKVEHGEVNGVHLDGLGVVAVVAASDTLGLSQTGPAKAVVIVDARADAAQRQALVQFAKAQSGDLLKHVQAVQTAPILLSAGECKGGTCAVLEVGTVARVETRCIDGQHDKTCGNEAAFYPPLAKDVHAKPAVALENRFSGSGFRETWKECDRRGAYVGSFEIR